MSGKYVRYDEDFKRTLVDLYKDDKTQSSLCREYGVSQSETPLPTQHQNALRVLNVN